MSVRNCILLATYNGEKYIEQLLESLDFIENESSFLVVNDDGSQDGTIDILRGFERKFSGRVFINENLSGEHGALNNFRDLISKAPPADYYFFCDQDDVWVKNKIPKMIGVMQNAEAAHGVDCPILAHSDLFVVDKDLKKIGNSFFEYQNLYSDKSGFNDILCQNIVTGCASVINRKLCRLMANVPAEAIMHDWWAALVASAFGKIVFNNESLVYYRQHDSNSVGAKKWTISSVAKKLSLVFSRKRSQKVVAPLFIQAKSFCSIYCDKLDLAKRGIILDFLCIEKRNVVQKIILLVKNKFSKNGMLRTLGFYFVVLRSI
ncbi:glycosyltransferase family 2 protein [Brachymonas sp. M4Q-1]|uniref:glycosyltransferase family 2 protein n=1 Tax=Brachymonas sp. M4Q-1 TaxID=3416906 RepID=UPI003CEFB0DA